MFLCRKSNMSSTFTSTLLVTLFYKLFQLRPKKSMLSLLSYFVIKSIISKNSDSIQFFAIFTCVRGEQDDH